MDLSFEPLDGEAPEELPADSSLSLPESIEPPVEEVEEAAPLVENLPHHVEEREHRAFNLTGERRVERSRLPTLELIDARVAEYLAIELSHVLNVETHVEARADGMEPWGELLDKLESPGCYNLVEFETLDGYGMVSIEMKLLFGLLERLFGGAGLSGGADAAPPKRERFSAIELRLIRRLVRIFGRAVEEAWRPVVPVAMRHLRVDTSPSNIAFTSPSAWVLASTFNIDLGSQSGSMSFALPFELLADYRELFASGRYQRSERDDHDWQQTLKQRASGLPVELIGELGRTNITLRQLASLKAGDVLRLDQSASEPVCVSIEGRPKYRAQISVSHGNLAVELTSLHEAS
ncbi:hypothetical protein FIV42_11610 [Persicimonas caeni]|uniref:Flagellar motor switch protein FliM n=1 Tax=Persicimonas caeni TaxID=2292766 RepID=A0A4Y6PT08_PERCE|nr:FliM/FliN family flagellar motor switch protein [Persicimonas caeni]QDG51363.1 hypothetical protein FIV42_11610 [Persicimonas caeni]QED32584.1 hypothetical protein FRD00_11605 [Persicimonas caeni]